jgi:hypothetical protein
MMEALRTSETSVKFNVTTRCYIPQDSKLRFVATFPPALILGVSAGYYLRNMVRESEMITNQMVSTMHGRLVRYHPVNINTSSVL